MTDRHPPVYLDELGDEELYDDTPEGERSPPARGKHRSPWDDIRCSAEYKSLRRLFLHACATTRNIDGTYGLPCALRDSTDGCPGVIDYNTHFRSPWAPTVDHKIPVRIRPDLILDTTNWQPAHKFCNISRGRTEDDQHAMLGEPSEKW